MTDIWAWFLSTRAGRALLGFGALAAAFAAACLYWFQHGKRAQATADAVKAAQADAENRKAAQEGYSKLGQWAPKLQTFVPDWALHIVTVLFFISPFMSLLSRAIAQPNLPPPPENTP